MENLIIQEGKQALTTSLKVAEKFEKRHDNVLRDVEKLLEDLKDVSPKDVLNFEEMSQTDTYGRTQRAYQMNRDGFTLLAMRYKGKNALKFQTDYIKAFNQMEEYIYQMQGKVVTTDEAAIIHELLNFYKFLNHCKKAEEDHKKRFIATHIKEGSPKEAGDLAKEFYKMRNTLLEIGSAKELEARYKRYCLQNPNAPYSGNASKFVMLLTLDKYEVVRGAIFDFLKMEWQTDNYSTELSKKAKNIAERANLKLASQNETNLFEKKEEDLIDMSKLRELASQLLAAGM